MFPTSWVGWVADVIPLPTVSNSRGGSSLIDAVLLQEANAVIEARANPNHTRREST
jgi:hypothetical protein